VALLPVKRVSVTAVLPQIWLKKETVMFNAAR